MRHRTAGRISIVVLFILSVAPAVAQSGSDPWYNRLGAKSKDFEPLTAYPGSFQIELPKEWQLVAGHAGTLFLAAEKTKQRNQPGAVVTLEHMRLQAAVDSSMLPVLAPELLKDVQAHDPDGTGFTQRVINAGDRSLILIQYDRRGLSTGQDHVVQYSMVQGATIYNLICIAPLSAIEKYRPLFAYTAASFALVKPSPAAW